MDIANENFKWLKLYPRQLYLIQDQQGTTSFHLEFQEDQAENFQALHPHEYTWQQQKYDTIELVEQQFQTHNNKR